MISSSYHHLHGSVRRETRQEVLLQLKVCPALYLQNISRGNTEKTYLGKLLSNKVSYDASQSRMRSSNSPRHKSTSQYSFISRIKVNREELKEEK